MMSPTNASDSDFAATNMNPVGSIELYLFFQNIQSVKKT